MITFFAGHVIATFILLNRRTEDNRHTQNNVYIYMYMYIHTVYIAKDYKNTHAAIPQSLTNDYCTNGCLILAIII